jgi:hypothetical protein
MSYKGKTTRDYRPHADALHGAEVLLKLSAEQRDGYYFEWLGSIILSAFAFEGYLNYMGRGLFTSSWDSFERSLSTEAKTILLADRIGLTLEEGRRPLQTIKALIKFRNSTAHLKPAVLEKESLTDDFKGFDSIKSDVEKFCTEANAKRCIEDVKEMMQLLYSHSGRRSGHPLIFGHEFYSAEPSP